MIKCHGVLIEVSLVERWDEGLELIDDVRDVELDLGFVDTVEELSRGQSVLLQDLVDLLEYSDAVELLSRFPEICQAHPDLSLAECLVGYFARCLARLPILKNL